MSTTAPARWPRLRSARASASASSSMPGLSGAGAAAGCDGAAARTCCTLTAPPRAPARPEVSTRRTTSPTLTFLPGRDADLLHGAGDRRRHFDGGLVGLQFEHRLFALDAVADLHQHVNDVAAGDVLAEFGQRELDEGRFRRRARRRLRPASLLRAAPTSSSVPARPLRQHRPRRRPRDRLAPAAWAASSSAASTTSSGDASAPPPWSDGATAPAARAGAALAAPPSPSTTNTTWPTLHLLAGLDLDLGHLAGDRRGHLDGRLVGLEFEDGWSTATVSPGVTSTRSTSPPATFSPSSGRVNSVDTVLSSLSACGLSAYRLSAQTPPVLPACVTRATASRLALVSGSLCAECRANALRCSMRQVVP